VLEIGAGSGCIIVTLACERPDLASVATDLSPTALAIARDNARRLGVEHRVTFVEGSLFAGLSGPWDLVVSNPPYVAMRDRPTLAPDVRDHEPALALYAGDDGLTVIRALVDGAANALSGGGALMMEIGAGQAEAVADLLKATSAFHAPAFMADLQGIARTVIATRR
jgi:release factor glutamine methyltransferase